MLWARFAGTAAVFCCSCLRARSAQSERASQHETPEVPVALTLTQRQAMQTSSLLSFSSTWEILGPFQIGTREAAWGADPLEFYGGFRDLEYNAETTYASSLSIDGVVSWSTLAASSVESSSLSAKANLVVAFPQIQWDFLQDVYGWSAVQFQGWARGYIDVSGTEAQAVVLYTDSVLEFWVDRKQYFGGDFYTFRKAPPVLHLEPGRHRIDVRLVRDVRAFGGVGEPTMAISLQLNSTSGGLELASDSIQISDVVNGRLSSPFASVTLRNSGKGLVTVTAIRTQNESVKASLLEPSVLILPGQTRPIAFNITSSSLESPNITFLIDSIIEGANKTNPPVLVDQTLKFKDLYEPHKVTFVHPGDIVSYFMLRPPQKNASCSPDDRLPVLFFLHGAGNEAEADAVARSMDPVTDICAWVIFPTGVTPWSADDWHNWGFADVETAVEAIKLWIDTVNWVGSGVNTAEWFMTGHSNGGQGTWYSLTHRPDRVFAAAPVSGYLSIQTYVPYHLWRLTDPRLVSVIQAATSSYRHELLISNAKGTPIHQQHGGIDDNVPAYNSRSMYQLIRESGWQSNYTELPGSGHYFDGVMTTSNLQAFYRQNVGSPRAQSSSLDNFTLTVANPGDTGSMQGFKVVLLQDPGQLGRLHVAIDYTNGITSVETSNVLRFQVAAERSMESVQIDGQNLSGTHNDAGLVEFERSSKGGWETFVQTETVTKQRRGRQLGPLDSIMRSQGRFTICYTDESLLDVALQVSRNLHQYYYADAEVCMVGACRANATGNKFIIASGSDLGASDNDEFPIVANESGISVQNDAGDRYFYGREAGIAALFLRPLDDEALELVVWAADAKDIAMAARLVPLQTGVGQPDFIILKREALWKGIDGVAAAGFFNHHWQVSKTSYLT